MACINRIPELVAPELSKHGNTYEITIGINDTIIVKVETGSTSPPRTKIRPTGVYLSYYGDQDTRMYYRTDWSIKHLKNESEG